MSDEFGSWDPAGWLDTITGGSRLRPPRRDEVGGEWDGVRQLGKHGRCRLAGGGWLKTNGYAPDVLAVDAAHILGKELDSDSFIDMYVRLANKAMDENQSRPVQLHQERRRRQAIAARHGHESFARYRDALAKQQGYRSLWHMRSVRWAS